MLHEPNMQLKVLKNEIARMKEKDSNENLEELKNYADVHEIYENITGLNNVLL